MTESRTWKSAASELLNRRNSDVHNHRILTDPWLRMAHCMVQAWRIRASQLRRRKRYPIRASAAPTNWKDAVKRMKLSLDQRANGQADRGTWSYWARLRCQQPNRYVKKSARRPTCDPPR